MLPCVALLLMGLPVCTVAGDSEQELDLSTEAKPWVIVTLEGNLIPGIQLQLQEVKNGKASQFFGLMGKREDLQSSQEREQGIIWNEWFRASWAGEECPQKVGESL
uniref:Tachykinin-4 n=1 Tax=Castor canadensis TaxID=51338 RepID=A0A8B7V5I9_CASCN|nr:tachykinin-4 [Castor canadensis]